MATPAATALAGPVIRWPAVLWLAAAVLLLHLVLARWVAESALELEGLADGTAVKRLRAVFVAELRPAAPQPVVPASPRTTRSSAAAAPAQPAASAPAPVAVVNEPPAPPPTSPEPPAEAVQAAPLAAASAPAAEPEAAAVPAVAAASAPTSGAPATPSLSEWPLSTQLTYRLSGNFRGPVEGQASVQWLREGTRYQVHLEVSVGPSFAPLLSRRMSSDGDIGPDGLAPRRYEEETRMALREPRRLNLQFDGPLVRLANGSEVPRPPGLQDAASQFVQLTWLFTTQPDRLRSGQSVDLMLALPRRVEPWTYDVLASETLQTPAGEIEAVHVRPRRPARPGDLTAEMWTAPSLQYLPVRIVIRQDNDTWVDLLLDRLPRQAAEVAPR